MTENEKPEVAVCGLCGKPMPPGEESFQYHGHSGPCPKTPVEAAALAAINVCDGIVTMNSEQRHRCEEEIRGAILLGRKSLAICVSDKAQAILRCAAQLQFASGARQSALREGIIAHANAIEAFSADSGA